MVEDAGFEPVLPACKAGVLPLTLIPHDGAAERNRTSASCLQGRRTSIVLQRLMLMYWWEQGESNPRHGFIRPALLPLSYAPVWLKGQDSNLRTLAGLTLSRGAP